MIKHHEQKQRGEEKVYAFKIPHGSSSLKGVKNETQGGDPETGTGVEAMGKCRFLVCFSWLT